MVGFAVDQERSRLEASGGFDNGREAVGPVSSATAMTTTAMYPNNDTLSERLRLYVEENFHNA